MKKLEKVCQEPGAVDILEQSLIASGYKHIATEKEDGRETKVYSKPGKTPFRIQR